MITVYGPDEADSTRQVMPTKIAVIDVTSHGKAPFSYLSPSYLGPAVLWGGYVARTVLGGWIYSTVYPSYYDVAADGPNDEWLEWAKAGWANDRVTRYPMGRDTTGVCTYWDGECLDIITARKQVYIPMYAKAARGTRAYHMLESLAADGAKMAIYDYDAYGYQKEGVNWQGIVENPNRVLSHAHVLAMMLLGMVDKEGVYHES